MSFKNNHTTKITKVTAPTNIVIIIRPLAQDAVEGSGASWAKLPATVAFVAAVVDLCKDYLSTLLKNLTKSNQINPTYKDSK